MSCTSLFICDNVPYYMIFKDDIVLVTKAGEEVNARLRIGG